MTNSDSTPKSRRRLLACLLALALGLVLTDVLVGKFYLARRGYSGPPLPPFAVLENTFLRGWFKRQREALSSTPAGEDIPGSYDQDLGWMRGAHLHPKRSGGLWYTRGARQYPAHPALGTIRMAGFGDSFLFGSEVSNGETFGAQLESLEPSVEFMNFGVAGYGLDQALLFFRSQKERLHADVVVVDVHVDCVRRVVTRCRSWQQPMATRLIVKPRFRLAEGKLELVPLPFGSNRELAECALAGQLETLLGEHEHWLGDDPLVPHSALARIQAAYAAQVRREYESLWLDRDGEAFRLTLAILETFRKEAFEAGANDFVILLFSNFRDFPRRDPVTGVDFLLPLREEFDRMRFDVLDFDRTLALEMDPRLNSRDNVFQTTHFNAHGNQLVAQALRDWLQARDRTASSSAAHSKQ